MTPQTKSLSLRLALPFVVAAAMSLSACATDPQKTGSVSRGGEPRVEQMTISQLNAEVRKWGAKYERNPKDKQTGLTYGALLRMTGRDDQALAVMRKMVIHHPTDNQVLSAYGKALAATGNLTEALDAVKRAQRPDHPDWRLLSAQGAILDQMDQPEQARIHYRKALDIVPDEPTVLSNLGMSYLLGNDLPSAETYLRKASQQRNADVRVRQNLALVVGLQGRFEEAERIASADLPPDQARANIAYLRDMLSQQNAWNLLKEQDEKKTN